MKMTRFLTLLVVLASTPAHAQVCTNDNNPRPANVTAVACDEPAACPNPTQKDDATHYAGGQIVFTPSVSTGACHPMAPNTFSNGCTTSAESCIAGQCVVQYEAVMYRPAGAAPQAPAVLLVPGSTNCVARVGDTSCVYRPERFCGIKSALLAKNYVVMEILPRGYGTDTTHSSTGYYIDDAMTQQFNMGAPCTTNGIGACSTYDLIDEGLFDVRAGYEFLANRPFVDATKIGVFGHSLGGIRALAFNRDDHGQRATIAVAPGSESWCAVDGSGVPNSYVNNTTLQLELPNSVDQAKSPIYTFMPRNDVNLESGSVVAHEAAENRLQYEASFFPAVRQGGALLQYGDEAHFCFVTNQRNVNEWAPTVINFLRRNGVK